MNLLFICISDRYIRFVNGFTKLYFFYFYESLHNNCISYLKKCYPKQTERSEFSKRSALYYYLRVSVISTLLTTVSGFYNPVKNPRHGSKTLFYAILLYLHFWKHNLKHKEPPKSLIQVTLLFATYLVIMQSA